MPASTPPAADRARCGGVWKKIRAASARHRRSAADARAAAWTRPDGAGRAAPGGRVQARARARRPRAAARGRPHRCRRAERLRAAASTSRALTRYDLRLPDKTARNGHVPAGSLRLGGRQHVHRAGRGGGDQPGFMSARAAKSLSVRFRGPNVPSSRRWRLTDVRSPSSRTDRFARPRSTGARPHSARRATSAGSPGWIPPPSSDARLGGAAVRDLGQRRRNAPADDARRRRAHASLARCASRWTGCALHRRHARQA